MRNRPRSFRLVIRLVGLALLLVVMLPLLIVGVLAADRWMKTSYIGHQLGCRANWEALDACFQSRFREGMPQKEVYDILVEIDPQLAGTLGTDLQGECTEYGCCEVVTPFSDRVGSAFGWVFCFDRDMTLTGLSVGS
jgi:hypothetical protein